MNRLIPPAMALVGLVALVGGCQNRLHDENLALHRQNRELQGRLNEAELRLQQAPNPAEVQRLQSELAARDQQIAALQAQLRQPQPGQPMDPSLAGIEVTRDERAGTVTVNIPGDVLFSSGQAELKESSKRTLDQIARALRNDYPGKRVFVDGHTDSDPINRTRDKWKDNLDLSAQRARVVSEYLAQRGVDPKLLGERAFAETAPKATKAASRRVEIVVQTRDNALAAGE
ncbi:MAG: OmpA family protein [Phycisphaerae bacterium]|nr:OmpA family protein [Phycisphaerae bacterium]MDW8263094.1 OmpA family protein [Phycisphaerales bacterium]